MLKLDPTYQPRESMLAMTRTGQHGRYVLTESEVMRNIAEARGAADHSRVLYLPERRAT